MVFTGTQTLLIALGAGVGGILLALLYQRYMAPTGKANRELNQALQQAKQELTDYKEEVSEHFKGAAQKLADLQESYRDIHNHLAQGAHNLMDLGNQTALLQTLPGPDSEPPPPIEVEQPRDYAPKRSPAEKGMLDESFGLDDGKRGKTREDDIPTPII